MLCLTRSGNVERLSSTVPAQRPDLQDAAPCRYLDRQVDPIAAQKHRDLCAAENGEFGAVD